MKYIIYIFILSGAIILQTTLGNLLMIANIQPDFVIISLCFLAMALNRRIAAIAGFAAGIILDSFGHGIIGTGSLVYSLSGFLAGSLLHKGSFQKLYEVISMFLLIIFLFFLLNHIFNGFLDGNFWLRIVTNVLPDLVYTMIFTSIFLLLLPDRLWMKQFSKLYE